MRRDADGVGDGLGTSGKVVDANDAGKGAAAPVPRLSASRRSQRVASARHGFLRCRQLPVVLDLMEDRVQSRLFTVRAACGAPVSWSQPCGVLRAAC